MLQMGCESKLTKMQNQIDNQDGVSSVIDHNEMDWEEAILNESNFLDTTKSFQEFFYGNCHLRAGGGLLTQGAFSPQFPHLVIIKGIGCSRDKKTDGTSTISRSPKI